MKIVVLDGYTENPGDLSWAPLEALGEVTVYDRTSYEESPLIAERIGDAEIVVMNKTPISKTTLEKCPNVKMIAVLATGFNVVDLAAAKERGIPVCNVPNYGGYSVSQFAIALMLEACLHIGHHDKTVHDGKWQNGDEWCYWDYPLIELAGKTYKEGDWISLDGSTGNIYGEAVATVPADPGSGYFGRLMGWADKYRQLMVYTNADTPRDAAQGRAFGAQGIGLCRTEHMFFEGERIKAMREMIVADNTEDRKKALAKIMPYQQGDFEGLYEAMEGCPVVIRFLDPPLHEFLPTKEEDIKEIAGEIGVTVERLHEVIASLHEFNPMMGHRGCRLAVSYPEIAEMQTTAVINAAINVQKKHPDWKMVPEIMIPLVGEVKELKYVKDVVVATADKIIKDAGIDMKYEVGTMIEIPRAALTADEIAKEAEFFSFGTNDLTQMTFGFSRDDAGKFLSYYYDKKIYESDPFAHLDQNGVGKLVAMAAKLGKETRPDIHLGICGEHGGDPTSVEFCHKVGLNYVSCSPYRVPIARLAAAQAAIKHPRAN